jgi:hypothetical protein
MGADRVARGGAACSGRPGALRASGKRRNAPGGRNRPGETGRYFLPLVLFSRLAGYEDVSDADRPCRDPVMRQLVGGRAVKHVAGSASAIERFETEMRTRPGDLSVLADPPRRRVDAVHDRRPPKSVTPDLDGSESPVHGGQEGAARSGHFRSKCPHPLFVLDQ